MANQTKERPEAPTITMKGTRVIENNGVITLETRGASNPLSVKGTTSNRIPINSGTVADKTYKAPKEYTWQNTVDVNMSLSNLELRTRDIVDVSNKQHVYYGDLAGVLNNSAEVNRAEIRYTVNGKDPSRNKFYRWADDASDSENIALALNRGGGRTVLKARTYHQGELSDATEVVLKVERSNTTNQKTFTNNSNSIGQPWDSPNN